MQSPIPSIAQCLSLMAEYAMYDNIRRHSLLVAQVADGLRQGLQRAGTTKHALPDKGLVIAGALLHDIAKTQCLKENCKHALVGEEICHDRGYPAVAPIVRDHVVLSLFTADKYGQGLFGATELVYYADKRVLHDRIVSLEDRLAYILERYGAGDPMKEDYINQSFSQCRELEDHLFAHLDFSPAHLHRHLSRVLPSPDDQLDSVS